MRSQTLFASALLAVRLTPTAALELNLDDPASVRSAARTVADDMMSWYTGNVSGPYNIPGLLPAPYYWWEAGAMFGSLIDYWYYTGDETYNDVTMEGMLFQTGPGEDYMPQNQSASLGNDDQAFWGIAAMTAAEANFPNPPADQPQWLALAQAVYNTQYPVWDNATCGGGLKWQKFIANNGYNYKNAISNGCFFNLAARLGRYTGIQEYLDWAEKTWDWTWYTRMINPDTYGVYDGQDDRLNCTETNHIEWSYNAGVYMYGAAVMYNVTEGEAQERWRERTQGLVDGAANRFFDETIMIEQACEPGFNCNIDQQTFKAYLSRWMAATLKVAPFTHDKIIALIRSSAEAAARSCTGGDDGTVCGTAWTTGDWDGGFGVGQQMNALEVIQSTLIDDVDGPLTNSTGGSSAGNVDAGRGNVADPDALNDRVSTSDRAGAGILTALVLSGLIGGGYWIVS